MVLSFFKKSIFCSFFLVLFSCSSAGVESLKIGYPKDKLSLSVGDTIKLVAIVVAPDDLLPTVEWKSSSSAVAAVEQDSKDSKTAILTARGIGECVITARSGKKEDSIKIKVSDLSIEKQKK